MPTSILPCLLYVYAPAQSINSTCHTHKYTNTHSLRLRHVYIPYAQRSEDHHSTIISISYIYVWIDKKPFLLAFSELDIHTSPIKYAITKHGQNRKKNTQHRNIKQHKMKRKIWRNLIWLMEECETTLQFYRWVWSEDTTFVRTGEFIYICVFFCDKHR